MAEDIAIKNLCPVRSQTGGLFVSSERKHDSYHVGDLYELLFVKYGTLEVAEKSGTTHLEENQTIIIAPGSDHRLVLRDTSNLAFYWILFSKSQASDTQDNSSLHIPKMATIDDPERMLELLHRYLDEDGSGNLAQITGSYLVALMLCEIARAVSRAIAKTDGVTNKNEDLVDRIKTYIACYYNRPICTSSIANELNYNPDYIERVFHGAVGFSLTEAIHRYRMKEAKRQLINNQKNVNEIAYATGFTDPGYFRRLFRRYTDMTPSRFRSMYGHVHLKIEA